jgi:hypothetical protein
MRDLYVVFQILPELKEKEITNKERMKEDEFLSCKFEKLPFRHAARLRLFETGMCLFVCVLCFCVSIF